MQPSPILIAEIERQLLNDLTRAGISPASLHIDWNEANYDGLFHVRQVSWQGSIVELQEYQSLAVIDRDGSVVAVGSYDFVYSGESLEDPFYIFWSWLAKATDPENAATIKYQHGIIPDHIWKQLSDSNKRNIVNQWENGWAKDPKVAAHNVGTSPFDENVGVGDYAKASHSIRLKSAPMPPKKI